MGNPLPTTTEIGTIGELLVQLRLLEYGIQSAPPIKDSGNDLIAIKGEVVKFIQVKTSKNKAQSIGKKLPQIYHIVALVKLIYSERRELLLDKSQIFVYRKGETIKDKRELTQEVATSFWNR
jgi:hypothetical protein